MCEGFVSRRDFLYRVLRDRRRMLLYSSPLLLGSLKNRETITLFVSVLRGEGSFLSVEKPPHRSLDLHFFLEELGVKSPYSLRQLLDISNVRAPPIPPYSNFEDVYALTHNIFYASQFAQSSVWLSFVHTDTLRLSIDTQLLFYVTQGNLDILLELVLARLILGGPQTPASQFAINYVIQRCESFDSIISPEAEYSRAFL
ncbi:MAG: DUF6895 family protein, partial [Nitrososphaera sp.]